MENGRVLTVRPADCQLCHVHELIEGGKWKSDCLQKWFNAKDVEYITSIPLSLFRRKDTLYWKHSKYGVYTVKIGYVVAKVEGETQSRRIELGSETS